ncbi:MAG: hypothetical protein KZQ64_13440 [gamma proteobacterium symbiont of Bathyaustriella thionipta]|nr:hypothetical protein [gamma proteobacterium symbiont of Bathyaustriella thionipta]MCU7948817.1 hypothetical protein [gamma proteobacterium symbiont of Bathyaustriella thionipta]MCU7954372.1 hypothetical protein [gamma proteobacterium symbiont of Bathyaustriella thionipta]MCU7955275.1 hypothetical protein [gamma proteobacterium symbiont of Bathyaustriella thionipta]MCU7966626.1 hypothetical protein [gamma proteobacterium symbiont of Bathyaustriella thionipta]
MKISHLISTAVIFAMMAGPTFAGNKKKVTICHNGETISISKNALSAHMDNHDDTMGVCPEADPVVMLKTVVMMRCKNNDGLIQISGVSSTPYDDAQIHQPLIDELSCAEQVSNKMNEGYKLKNVNTGLVDGETEYLFIKEYVSPETPMVEE